MSSACSWTHFGISALFCTNAKSCSRSFSLGVASASGLAGVWAVISAKYYSGPGTCSCVLYTLGGIQVRAACCQFDGCDGACGPPRVIAVMWLPVHDLGSVVGSLTLPCTLYVCVIVLGSYGVTHLSCACAHSCSWRCTTL